MSKLDEVEYEIYGAIPPQHPDGQYKKITPKTREQLKAVFSELIESERPAYATVLEVGKNQLLDRLIEKVRAL